MYRIRRLAAVAILALMACCGCFQSDQPQYKIKILYRSLEVEMVETSTGETREIDESADEMTPNGWCTQPHSLVWSVGCGGNSFADHWWTMQEIRALVPLASKEIPPDAQPWTGPGTFETCHPELGIEGAVGSILWNPPVGTFKVVVLFRCIHDCSSEEVTFVDYEIFSDGGVYSAPSPRAFFDVEGNYYYYHMHGMAKRYSVSDGQIDTLVAGEFPMIPWNDEAVIVYSEFDQEYRLLDGSLAVKASVSGDLKGEVLSVYMLDKSTFIFGCKRLHIPGLPSAVDVLPSTALFELNFRLGTMRELSSRGLGVLGQILSVERVE